MGARKPEIIAAAPEHIGEIAAKVRVDDAKELAALCLSPESALRLALRSALAAWTGLVDGVPVCMFGVSPGELGEGRPWMIGTKDLDRHAVIFLRRCQSQVEEMLRIRPVLVNYVAAGNIRALQWLRWLGFVIEEPIPWGPRRALFCRFERRAS